MLSKIKASFGGNSSTGSRFGGDPSWPLTKVVGALEGQYGAIEALGEEGPLKVFGVQENGVNFVVAIMQTAADSGKVAELGFLARFVGFEVELQLVETINRNLHISMVSMEGADLFLMAGMQVAGAYDQSQFKQILDTWRRDLMVTLQGLSSDQSSMAAAFPAARLESARAFAVNAAPAPVEGRPADMLSSFLGANMSKAVCDECGGRGKRGFIAKFCGDCDGTGFVNTRR